MISLHETGKYVLRLDGRSGKQLLFEPDLGNHVAAGVWRFLVELGGFGPGKGQLGSWVDVGVGLFGIYRYTLKLNEVEGVRRGPKWLCK